MRGADILGLISDTIEIVDAIVKIHVAMQDASGLPSSFREVGRRMPLLKDTLQASQRGLKEEDNEISYVTLKQVIESCNDKVAALEQIFRETMVAPGASRPERYVTAARALAKARRVQVLMNGITDNMRVLTTNYAAHAATRSQAKHLIEKMRERSVSNFSAVAIYGLGAQHVHSGDGVLYINTGSGAQLNGRFEGPFNFRLSTKQTA
ncbi:SesA protein [Xylaria curta]|nr:SesA protein [Xylaria curta]